MVLRLGSWSGYLFPVEVIPGVPGVWVGLYHCVLLFLLFYSEMGDIFIHIFICLSLYHLTRNRHTLYTQKI